MTSNLRSLGGKLAKVGAAIGVMEARGVEAAAVVMERAISRQIGDDARRRRVAGGTVGVTRRNIGTPEHPAVLVKATGPLHLLANPTKGHAEAARNAAALRTPYGPRSRVQHPGTPGKDTWHKGVDKGSGEVLVAADVAAATVLREALR